MASDPTVHFYVARTPTDDRVLAVGPDDVDPAEEKLCWYPLGVDQDHNELLDSLGYQSATIKTHPDCWNIIGAKRLRLRFGKTQLRQGVLLIDAKQSAELAGLIPEGTPENGKSKYANTFRVYARRGHGPKPYDTRKKPMWAEPEVKWWVANRTGQGRRTDKTKPTITHD